jgi:hypothetical protein
MIKNQFKKLAPLMLNCVDASTQDTKVYISISPQRSGQHLIIRWLCENIADVVHFNHCYFYRRNLSYHLTPINGRRVIYRGGKIDDNLWPGREKLDCNNIRKLSFQNMLFSMEDVALSNNFVKRIVNVRENIHSIVILRDPYNWLASTMKKDGNSKKLLEKKKSCYIQYLEQALGEKDYLKKNITTINYNKFLIEAAYREGLCNDMNIHLSQRAEESLQDIPTFGGGSSFSGHDADIKLIESVFLRWKSYKNNSLYRGLIDDERLVSLTDAYFGDFPYRQEIRNTLQC